MPYIVQERRVALDSEFGQPQHCGELNYKISILCLRFGYGGDLIDLKRQLLAVCEQYARQSLSYQRINDVMGALDCAARELARRDKRDTALTQMMLRGCAKDFYDLIAAPYEDTKITANGDLPYEV